MPSPLQESRRRRGTGPVFVVGTGRSGTHWVGHTLADHPEIRATIEARPMYQLATRLALDPSLERRLMPRLLWAYRWQLLRSFRRLYVDKSHPNLWHAETLARAFRRARFVAIQRSPHATVASMLRHEGVLAWHRRWREFPVPNRFLGIGRDDAGRYDELSRPTQCAMRWLAHRRRLDELRGVLGDRLLVICYEDFARETAAVIARLQEFLRLREPMALPEVRTDSVDKWRRQLTPRQIADIDAVVGAAGSGSAR